jgi:serine/threonine protein phosphatase PrpC
VAHVGDSSVYSVHGKNVKKITVDHKPDVKAEFKRVKNSENFRGVVDGYVVNSQEQMLAMTRAIGDHDFGDMVTAEPDIQKLEDSWNFVLLGSDGLWDVMPGSDVWKEVQKFSHKNINTARKVLQVRNKTYPQHDNSSLIVVQRLV